MQKLNTKEPQHLRVLIEGLNESKDGHLIFHCLRALVPDHDPIPAQVYGHHQFNFQAPLAGTL